MTLTITIEMDNAAFEDEAELSRILTALAEDFAGVPSCGLDVGEDAIMDINGNTVGKVEVTA